MLSFLFAKNNPLKLYETFIETEDSEIQDKIIQRLIELDSEGYLFDIQKRYSNNELYNYFYTKYADDADKLYQMFPYQNSENKLNIIRKLIELRNDSLLKNFLNTEYENEIFPFLLNKYQNYPEKLFNLLGRIKQDNQEKIIQTLIFSKSLVELKKIYLSEFRPILINFLLNNYEILNADKEDFFLNLHPDLKNEIIQKMIVIKSQKDSLSYSIDFMHIAVLKTQDCDLKEFIYYWEPYVYFLTKSQTLQIFFFNLLNDKQKLFLLLWHYGIDKYYSVPPVEQPFDAVEIYYHNLNDCLYYGLEYLINLFDEVFSDIVASIDYRSGILAFLIDHEKFYRCLDDAEVFIEEMFCEKKELLESNALINENKSNDSGKISQINDEISYLVFLRNFHILKTLTSFPVDMPESYLFSFMNFPLGEFFGKKLSLKTLNFESKIVENKMLEKLKIEQHRDRLIITLNDARSIKNLKEIAETKCNNLIEKNDFIYTLKKVSTKELYQDRNQTILGIIFSKSTDTDVQRAILKSINPELKDEWLKFIHQSSIDLNDPVIVSLFNRIIKNNTHPKNFPLLCQTLHNEPTLLKITQISHVHPVRDINFSKNRQYFLSASGDKSIVIYNLVDGSLVRFFHSSDITKAMFDGKAHRVFSAGTDKSIKVFDVLTQELVETVSPRYDLDVLTISSDGQFIVGRRENSLKIFSLVNKKVTAILKYNQFKQNAMITDNMKYLLSWSNFEIHITDFLNFSNVKLIKVDRSINSFDLSFDNQYILLGCGDRWKGEIRIYNVETLNLVYSELFDNNVTCARFSTKADVFAVSTSGKENGEVLIYSSELFKLNYKFTVHKAFKTIHFWKNYPYIACYSDRKLEIYDTKKRNTFKTLYFENPIQKVVISDDGYWLLVAEGTESHLYHLLDVLNQSLFNILEHLLQLRIEQNSETFEFLYKQKELFKNHPSNLVRQSFARILQFIEL